MLLWTMYQISMDNTVHRASPTFYLSYSVTSTNGREFCKPVEALLIHLNAVGCQSHDNSIKMQCIDVNTLDVSIYEVGDT